MLTDVRPQNHRREGLEVPDDPAAGWTAWRFAAVAAAACVMVCLFCTFLLPTLLGDPMWMSLGDFRSTVQSTQFATWGGLGSIYSANVEFLPLPGFLFVLAPAVALGDHLGLLNPYPFYLRYPSIWPLVAPVAFVSGSTSILGVDYLAATLGISAHRRRVVAVSMAAFVVLPTCCWIGHPEDLLSLALSSVSLGLLIRGRHRKSACVLSVAVMMQPWALLLIPLLTVASPAGARVRTVVRASLLPAVTGLALMAFDFKDAFRSLVIQPMQGRGQRLPWWAFTHKLSIIQDGAAVTMRVGSGPRALAVIISVVAAVAIRRDIRPANIMLVAAIALVSRGIFETQVWCYYLAPGAVFLTLLVAQGTPCPADRRRWIIGAVAAFAFYGFAAASYDGYSMPSLLALAVMVVSSSIAVTASRRWWVPAAPNAVPA